MWVLIGAGQSGLVTCKTFLETNKNVLFDNLIEQEYFKWSSSRYISGFSDFPIPKSFPIWMNMAQFAQYLALYKSNFNLDKNILYKTEVLKTIPIGNKWKQHYLDTYIED